MTRPADPLHIWHQSQPHHRHGRYSGLTITALIFAVIGIGVQKVSDYCFPGHLGGIEHPVADVPPPTPERRAVMPAPPDPQLLDKRDGIWHCILDAAAQATLVFRDGATTGHLTLFNNGISDGYEFFGARHEGRIVTADLYCAGTGTLAGHIVIDGFNTLEITVTHLGDKVPKTYRPFSRER